MSKLGLTQEERALVARMAIVQESTLQRLSFYSAALLPAVAFGVYGVIRADIVALIVGYSALLLFTYWRLSGEFGATSIFNSICAKIDAFERVEPRPEDHRISPGPRSDEDDPSSRPLPWNSSRSGPIG